eukprot:scaffold1283_cov364-Pavlova_lutheri.AAC.7
MKRASSYMDPRNRISCHYGRGKDNLLAYGWNHLPRKNEQVTSSKPRIKMIRIFRITVQGN